MNRVVVTGVGAVTPLGHTVPAFWEAITAARCGFRKPTFPRADQLQTLIVADVVGLDPDRYFSARELQQMDRVSQFAVIAAGEAVAQSGVTFDGHFGERTAVVVGTGMGGQTAHDEELFYPVYGQGKKRVRPLTLPRMMMSAASSQVSMRFGIRGPTLAVSTACAASTHAIGIAFQMVRSGSVDCAVAGGAEAPLTFGTVRGWEALRVLASDRCRPFSSDRTGLVLGEGAAMIVLESWSHARTRGAAVIGELIGFGMTADAADLLSPDERGIARAISGALADAAIDAEDVDYVNAHGTGTIANDVTETRGLKASLRAHAYDVPISSTKSMIGHSLGAAGAIELVAVLMALRTGVIPPTAGFTSRDPDCDLDYVPNEARQQRIGVALSNSFGFGGLNGVLAVRRFDA